jgi:hypothetical protein
MYGRAGLNFLKRACCRGRTQTQLNPAPKVRKIRFKCSVRPVFGN